MKKFKLKDLLKVFFFLIGIQLIIGLADILLSQANSDLSSTTALLITICSFPISLINSDLPFFVSESLPLIGLYWIINLMIQAAFVYLILIVVEKIRDTK